MRYQKANPSRLNGSYHVGEINVNYSTLVKCFGLPHGKGDGYKVDAEWFLEFEDGYVASIYNYKDGKNYLGKEGQAVVDIVEWNVGGFDRIVIDYIKDIVER